MRYGICTNQPTLCRRAAARDLMQMTGPDTRCQEPGCGKPLLPAPGGPVPTKGRFRVKLFIGAIALIAVGVLVYRQLHWSAPAGAAPEVPAPPASAVAAPPVNPVPAPPGPAVAPPSASPIVHAPLAHKANPCSHVNWESAGRDMVVRCKGTEVEAEESSLCRGMTAAGCANVRHQLGLSPVGVGPGTQR